MNFLRYTQRKSACSHPIRLVCSMICFLCALFLLVSIITFSRNDVSWFVLSTHHHSINNGGGYVGAYIASLLVYLFGVHAFLLSGQVLLVSFFLFTQKLWYVRGRLLGGMMLLFSGPVVCRIMDYDPLSLVVPGGLVGHYGVALGTQFVTAPVVVLLSGILWAFGWILFLHIPIGDMMRATWRICISLYTVTTGQREESIHVPSDYLEDMQLRLHDNVSDEIAYYNNNDVSGDGMGVGSTDSISGGNVLPTGTKGLHSISKKHRYTTPKSTIFEKTRRTSDWSVIPPTLQELASILEHKLERFGVKGTVSSIKRGPVVTLFEYEPNVDSKISKIIALEDDLALALQALSIRIIAPIPGRSVVGFEVANDTRSDVLFSDIIYSNTYQEQTFLLPIVLGVDTVGDEVLVDLARMPHLLVAGSTGSGKSVGLNTMLVSLLCSLPPDDLQLILIDPKRLEFVPYADIPHLLFPIVTNPHYASPVLRWVVNEMERRYNLMAACGVRNSVDYQQYVRGNSEAEPMPFIVVVIDEFADLMMTAGKEIEGLIARIAQMARAAGIHMVVATQRPSVDVITGLIKANFPSRIAFRVSSRVDSRTIIDTMGAHKLLGRGDMLFMNSSDSLLQRVHGAYVSDSEIEKLMCHLKAQGEPDYLDITSVCPMVPSDKDNTDDALYLDIKRYVQEVDEVSISSIQRTFRIGYNRSARIIERLESEGLILPAQGGGKMRKVIR